MTDPKLDLFKGGLDNILNAVADPLFVKDRHHRWVVMNDAFCRMIGRPREELLGRSDYDFFPKEQADIFWAKDEIVFESGRENINEEKLTGADGAERWIVTKKTAFDSGGERFLVGIIRDITEIKATRDRLQQNEERLKLSLEGSNYGIWEIEVETGRLIFSESILEWLQLNVDEKDRNVRTWEKLVHPEDRPAVLASLSAHLRGEAPHYEAEYRFCTGAGGWAWVHARGQVGVRAADGKPLRIFGTVQDITERKVAEERLRRSEQLLNTVFSSLNDAVLLVDLRTRRIVDCNQAAERVFGYARRELVNEDTRKIHVNEEMFRLFGERKREAHEAHGYFEAEFQMRRKNDEVFPAEIFTKPILKKDASADLEIGVVRDISRRKKSEEVRARLSEAVEQSTESIVITDVMGKILYANPAVERVTGYRREELLGKNPRVLRSGKHDRAFYEKMWASILKGETWRGRFTNRRKDGTLYEEEAIISPVRDGEGKIASFVAIKRDITHQTEIEQQLLQAQKMDAVGRLAGGVAHDFNNLLTSILGFAQMLLDDADPKSGEAADLKEIIKAGERAAALTQQLLGFSRKQVIEPRALDLNAAVLDMESMLTRSLGEHIRLKIVPEKEIWRVKLDPNQVGQVLVNLTLNARDAMPRGGVLVVELKNERVEEKVSYRHEQIPAGDYVVLSVSDTGTGMSEEVQAHLFEPFFTSKPKGKGTGLGLATVYGIVKQNHGFITVYTEEGKGTTVRIYLPKEDLPAAPDVRAGEAPEACGGTETVLLVEDEGNVRLMAKRVLEEQGYRVLACDGGPGALQAARGEKGPIHLLLTDVVMPGMSGPELAAKLLAERPGVKVLFMSGYTNEMISAHGVLDQGTNFLQKPFTPKKLTGKVREVLGTPNNSHPKG